MRSSFPRTFTSIGTSPIAFVRSYTQFQKNSSSYLCACWLDPIWTESYAHWNICLTDGRRVHGYPLASSETSLVLENYFHNYKRYIISVVTLIITWIYPRRLFRRRFTARIGTTFPSSAISVQAMCAPIAIEPNTSFRRVGFSFGKPQFHLKSGTPMTLRPPVSGHRMPYPGGLLVE